MAPLDLHPEWIVTPGDRVITRRVESGRAREAASRKRRADIARALARFA
jgi:hypothetical protein